MAERQALESTPLYRQLQPCNDGASDYGTCHSNTPFRTTLSRVYDRDPSASAARKRTVVPAETFGTDNISVDLAATCFNVISVPPACTNTVIGCVVLLVTLIDTSTAAAGVA